MVSGLPQITPLSPYRSLKVTAIVPAYNESDRVLAVLEALCDAARVDEIFVVTDGCTDDTAFQVRNWLENRSSRRPVRLWELTQNIGKGGAMTYGAHRTDADILLFLDADLIGLRPSQVEDMLAPMLRENEPAAMTLGLFGGILGWWLGWCHRAAPSFTGQRAIRREVFLSVPGLTRSRFGVETAITRTVQNDPAFRVDYVYIHNVTHPIKEEKLGPMRGFRNRMRMYREIGAYLLKDSLRQQAARTLEEAMRMRERFGNK